MRISDWSSDVCSSDLIGLDDAEQHGSDDGARHVAEAAQDDAGDRLDDRLEADRRVGRVDRYEQAAGKPRQGGADAEADGVDALDVDAQGRSEEHTSELQSLMRISYAVFCLKKKKK